MVALITSAAEGIGHNVMACESTSTVSMRPLRILSVIERTCYTHELVTASGEFGVNLCADKQADLSSFAGNSHGRDVAKLADPRFAEHVYPAKRIGAPMLRGCVINLECVVEQTIDLGTHTGFVGRAVAGKVNRDARPLLYHQGRYFGLGAHIAKSAEAGREPAASVATGSAGGLS
jgi:flavin reductase (DIM6/NTAB) family NADH-FMN oxidoreductase RutF